MSVCRHELGDGDSTPPPAIPTLKITKQAYLRQPFVLLRRNNK